MRHARIPVWAASGNSDWKTTIMKAAERGEFDRQAINARRSSLIKLASEALRVHVASTTGNVCPRDDAGNSEPLALAAACLATAARNQKENS
jgi:hypothetical protein